MAKVIKGTGRRLALVMTALAIAVGGYVALGSNDQASSVSGDPDAMAIGIVLHYGDGGVSERGIDTSPIGIVLQ